VGLDDKWNKRSITLSASKVDSGCAQYATLGPVGTVPANCHVVAGDVSQAFWDLYYCIITQCVETCCPSFSNLPEYDDDAAAGTAGLLAGQPFVATGGGAIAAGTLLIKQ